MQTISFPEHCDRGAVAAMHADIAAAIEAGDVTVDATGVARGGQALLQMLLSAQKTARAQGTAFVLCSSDALGEIIAIAGLSGDLGAGAA